MSWAEPADMDTLSELPRQSMVASSGRPPKLSRTASSVGRSAKSRGGSRGASKSERRLLMEAKAGVGAAIAEDRQERLVAKRRARRTVRVLYYAMKVVGVAACVYTSGLNATLVYMRPDFGLQDRLVRSYLVLFGVGGVLAELDTPFAKANFRALQKWWFKAPFYVFMAWLCFDASLSRGTVWFPLELASFVALQTMGAMALVLNVCLREVLERSGALGKRRGKKTTSSSSRRLRRGASGINSSSRGSDGARGGGSSGGLGVSSFRERDRRRRSRPSSSPTDTEGGFNADRDRENSSRRAPEMVPERAMSGSGRLLSPTQSVNYGGSAVGFGGGGGRAESYGTGENGGGSGDGLGGAISGKIKWWLDRGGSSGDGESAPLRRGGGRERQGEFTSSMASPPASVSTARSGRTNWWEDSDGDDDGSSSLASFAQSDGMSDVGSSVSGMGGAGAGAGGGWGEGGGRYGSNGNTQYPGGRGIAAVRRAPSVVSSSNSRANRSERRRFGGGSVRGGLEQRPPPLTMQAGRGGTGTAGGRGGPVAGDEGYAAVFPDEGRGGGAAHVALTAQALARNSNESLPPSGRGFGRANTFGGGGSVTGSVSGGQNGGGGGEGGGSLRGFGPRRSSRRPGGWEARGGAPNRASSVSGDAFRGAGAGSGWPSGASDYDLGQSASEVGLDFDREESSSRHPRPGANVRRGPEIQDYTPF